MNSGQSPDEGENVEIVERILKIPWVTRVTRKCENKNGIRKNIIIRKKSRHSLDKGTKEGGLRKLNHTGPIEGSEPLI